MANKENKRILVIRLSALGDVAMTIPAIYSVARTYPQHRFYVLTMAFCTKLFIHVPENITLCPVKDRKAVLEPIKGLKFDAVADLHNVMRSWKIDLRYLLRGVRVAMLDKKRCERHAITHQNKYTESKFTARYFDVFRRLGLPCEPQFDGLFDKKPTLPLQLTKLENEHWIGIAPFARYKNKTYPANQMREVIALLSQKENVRIFLFGGRGEEKAVLDSWSEGLANVKSIAGTLQLHEELALMGWLDTMISMDSANMHLASLAGVRVVSIWGGHLLHVAFLAGIKKNIILYFHIAIVSLVRLQAQMSVLRVIIIV